MIIDITELYEHRMPLARSYHNQFYKIFPEHEIITNGIKSVWHELPLEIRNNRLARLTQPKD
jgi:hypothetical protein